VEPVYRLVEPAVALVTWMTLRALGYGGGAPWWLVVGCLCALAALHLPAVQRRVTAGDPARYLWLRLAVHLGATATLLYAIGWGPMVGAVALVVLAQYVTRSGSASWRPGVVVGLATMALGQLALAAGWITSYLTGHTEQVAALIGASALVLGARAIGVERARQERAEARLRSSEERFRALVQDSSDVTWVLGADRLVEYVSPAVEHVMGYRPADVVGTHALDRVHPDDRAQAEELLRRVLVARGDEEQRVEIRARHADGSWHWHEAQVRNRLGNPAVRGIVVIHRDVTARRSMQDRLTYEATHDHLTGVANRTSFLRALERSGTLAALGRHTLAVLFLDLDGFKHINETVGHQAGDQLLAAVGEVLRRSVLGADVVGRLGGDEFAVVLTNIAAPEHMAPVARRILGELDTPVTVAGQDLRPRASIGLAMSTPDCSGPMELLSRASVAMHHAKRAGQHGYQVYAEGMSDRDATGEPTLEDDLRLAAERGQLRVQYQPVVTLERGEMIGCEALVRWEHPVRGWMPPQTFIPLAEATGLIVPIGAWVLEEACRQVGAWRRRTPGARQLAVSVNLSPRQLTDEALIDTVLDILDRTGFPPEHLVLEVTESALVDYEASAPRLETFNKHGIRVALDDFGTGYSSLRYLTRLPVNVLKLDQCFVAELNGTPEGSALAEAVVRLGQSLHLSTVAEGIENAAQAAELTRLGYACGQGYYYSRPMHPQDVDRLLDDAGDQPPVLPVPVQG
jgi:diguanylate cyclase (GGDEF)-like protein/PAS domain S-box-containing protein